MTASATSREPVAVVGAGVAGLCCALHLERSGKSVVVLEASDRVGGRVATDRVDGFRVDRGFQVLLTAYPEVQAMLDLSRLRLRSYAPGAMVFADGALRRIADPMRRPSDALRTLASGVASPLDALRILRLRRRVRRETPESLLAGPSKSALDALRDEGFSERLVERFFRPFFGGVLLDRELRSSSRALDYFFRMFSTGDAALPADGMRAIPAQLAAGLAPGTLRLRTPVAQVEAGAVVLGSGDRLRVSATVVATEAHAAAKLVPGLAVPESHPACALSFDAPKAPPVGDFLVLDGTGEGPVNELAVPSNVVENYAPPGRALVSASVLAPRLGDDDEGLEQAARSQLEGWFGPEVREWRLLRIDRIAHALPAQPPGPFEPAPREPRLAERLFVCGDHRDLASLQGAMASGRRAAEAVDRTLR